MNEEKRLPNYEVNEPVALLFGIQIHACTMANAINHVNSAVIQKHSIDIGMLNAAKIVNMNKNRELKESVLSSNFIMADGASVVMASRLLSKPLPERVAGIDLMFELLKLANEHRYRVFLLGATEDILQAVVGKISDDYPYLTLAGVQHGYFSEPDEQPLVEQIAESKPDILLVAMTSPKKEKFIAKYSAKMRVPVVHGVGGSFDVYADKVKRAPIRWQKYGFEWLYRLLQEPRRLFYRYLITNTTFIFYVIKERISPTQSESILSHASNQSCK